MRNTLTRDQIAEANAPSASLRNVVRSPAEHVVMAREPPTPVMQVRQFVSQTSKHRYVEKASV